MSVKVIDRDLGWGEFFKRAKEIKNARVKVGVLADSAKGGLHVPGGTLTVAEIAAVVHYGTKDGHIPARPFLTTTFDRELQPLTDLGKKLMGQVLEGRFTVKQALNILGATLADKTKKTVTDGMDPPNAPSTIAHKGSSKPLIDTGRMLNAVTWAIDDGKESE